MHVVHANYRIELRVLFWEQCCKRQKLGKAETWRPPPTTEFEGPQTLTVRKRVHLIGSSYYQPPLCSRYDTRDKNAPFWDIGLPVARYVQHHAITSPGLYRIPITPFFPTSEVRLTFASTSLLMERQICIRSLWQFAESYAIPFAWTATFGIQAESPTQLLIQP